MIELQSQLNPTRVSSIQPHEERSILRVYKSLAKSKNRLRQGMHCSSGSSEFLAAVKAHNKATRSARSLQNSQSTRRQESAFRKKYWSFAKSACSDSSKMVPTFSEAEAFAYFSNSFSSSLSNLYSPCLD